MGRPNFTFAGACALVMLVAMLLVAGEQHLPIRDPDGVAVPTYVRLPVILLLAWLVDVLPRAVARAHGVRLLPARFAEVVRERWTRAHVLFALSGLGTWYVCYATFRNLKSYVPFVNSHLYDATLDRFDRTAWLGHDPAVVLHSLFGSNAAAEVFSFVYVAWIVLIPVALAIALMWTRHPAAGSWFVTAIAVDWLLGVAAYFAVPTLGPIYSKPWHFAGLRHTYTTTLESDLLHDRQTVLAGPHATHAVQTIAAFPSLHVGMMVTVALLIVLIGMPRWLQITGWVFLALTVLATIYLGWHFFADAIGGTVLGAAAVWVAAVGTGNHLHGVPRLVDRGSYDREDADQPTAALSRRA